MLNVDYLRRVAEQRLSPKKYRHSLCVQKRAVELARRYGADWYKAGIAGLLHDICKSDATGDQLKYIKGSGILLDTLTLELPALWHAIAGAAWAERELGIRDGEILDAIRYHTSGRAEMSLLEKVVYLADVTSEDREYPDVEHTRALADRSLDEGMAYVLSFTMKELTGEESPVVRDAWEGYNYYLMKQRYPGG